MGTEEGSFYDPARIIIGPLTVPPNQKSIRFDFFFLSAEYPEYVGSKFNDIFTARIYGSSLVADGTNIAEDAAGNEISINSVTFALNEYQVTGSGFEYVGGGTGLLTASALVSPGDVIRLELFIADVGDHIYDSAVMLDNVRFSTKSDENPVDSIILTPNEIGMLVGDAGEITVTLTNLAPDGGLNINLQANKSGIISLSPQTVHVPEGSNKATQTVVVSALALGEAIITASAPNYDHGKTVIRVGTDLFILDGEVALTPAGQGYEISATIHNQGMDVQSVEVTFIEENLETNVQKQIGPLQIIPQFASGTMTTITQSFVPASGNGILHVRLDPFNKIAESNEHNNAVSKPLSIQKPQVTSVTAKYTRSKNPEVFGRYISELNGTINTFYATTAGEVSKVIFELNGNTQTDENPDDGWSAMYDMGALPAGNHALTVTAYSIFGIASNPMTKIVQVEELPWWLKANLTIWEVVKVEIDHAHLSFGLRFKIKESKGGGPFDYIVKINEDVMFIPKEDIGAKTELELSVGIPLDPALGWKISGRFSVAQEILDHDVGSIEVPVAVFLNPDYSLHSFLLAYEREALLFGLEIKQSYPLTPGLNAVIGGGFDVYGKMKVQGVAKLIDAQIKFVITPDGEKSTLTPGLGLKFNLIGGLEIIFGLVSGELVLSPRFDLDIGVTYVNYPVDEGAQIFASGEGKVEWKVIGSVFWGAWEKEIVSGEFGPWPIFKTPSAILTSQFLERITYTDAVQLPTILPLPSIAADVHGNVMVVWLEKESGSNAPPQIYFAYKTVSGGFNPPQALVSNNFYKSDPKFAFGPDGTASAVWVQNSQPESFVLTNPTLAEILRYQDIYYSTWDKNSWSPPVLLTPETEGSQLSDGVPTILVSPQGNEKLVLWTRNASVNSLDRANLEIYYARITDAGIGAPAALTFNQAADLMVRGCYYDEENAIAIWLRDDDGNPETMADFEIYYSVWNNASWTAPARVTNNGHQEKDLSIAALRDGRAIAAWVEVSFLPDSSLSYALKASVYDAKTKSWSTPEAVSQSHHFIETPIIQVDQRNIATITWRGYKSINGDLLISLKDFRASASSWTSPKPLTDDDLVDWMIATAIDTANNQYFVNLKSSTDNTAGKIINRPNFHGGLSLMVKGIQANAQLSDEINLNQGTYPLEADLAVDSTAIVVVDSALRENKISDLEIHVKNIGVVISDTTVVRVYQNDPYAGKVQIGADLSLPILMPDSSHVFHVPFIFSQTNHIYVEVDPDSTIKEQSETNNSAERIIRLLPDLALQNVHIQFSGAAKVNDAGTVTASVRNLGQISAQDVTLKFIDKGTDTTAAGQAWNTTILPEIKPDTMYAIAFPYTAIRSGRSFLTAQIDSEATIEESNETNNIAWTSFEVLPDLRIDSLWYDANLKKVFTIVANVGGDTARSFQTSFYQGDPLLDGIRLSAILTDTLDVAAKDTFDFSYAPPAGLANLHVWVDSAGAVSELSKENNKGEISIITPGSVDLSTQFTFPDTTYPIGDPFPITLKIMNIGTKGANSISYQITENKILSASDSVLTTRVISILNPQGSHSDTVLWVVPDSALVKFNITVDPGNSIVELDETNNEGVVFLQGFVKVTHKIALEPGWNMISSFVRPIDLAVSGVFGNLDAQTVVVKNNSGQIFWPAFGINTIGQWNHNEGYQVHAPSADTMIVAGKMLVPEATAISLAAGWNMVAYLRHSPMRADSALASVVNDVVIAKNNKGQVYWPEFGINTMGAMQPGQGYKIYLAQASTLTYPANSGAAPTSTLTKNNTTARLNALASASHYPSVISNTGANAILMIEAVELKKGDEIAIWTTNKMLVGSSVINHGRAIITINGDNSFTEDAVEGAVDGDSLTLTAWSASEQKEHSLSISLLTDALTGEPLASGLRYQADGVWIARIKATNQIPASFTLAQNYPNPFNASTVIKYGLPQPAKVKLEVFNLHGQRVALLVNRKQKAGYHAVTFGNADLSSGVYFYRLQAGQFVETRKMVIVR
jgi:subtilase family serine protease